MGYELGKEKKNLSTENWDLLIILDACRFDYFKEIFREYIKAGTLDKAITPSTHTMIWLNKFFPNYYDDIIYLSANPYINSKFETKSGVVDLKYDGKKHFYKIIDIWDEGWDPTLASVHPETVNDFFYNFTDTLKNKRCILHYIQPHTPYISNKYISYLGDFEKNLQGKRKERMEGTKKFGINKKPIRRMRNYINYLFDKITKDVVKKNFGIGMAWKIDYYTRGKTFQSASIFLEKGWQGIHMAYKENLRLVLASVSDVIKNFDGNILITSDHGEFLGEYGLYGHSEMIKRPENTEVPWLRINKGGKKSHYSEDKYVGKKHRVDEKYRINKIITTLKEEEKL